MSGIEVAGLVLAVAPLLISAVEDYHKVQSFFERTANFPQQLEEFLEDIEDEVLAFKQNIDVLFAPLVKQNLLNINDVEKLLSNPQDPLWRKPVIEYALRSRLGRSYERYVAKVACVHRKLATLNDSVNDDLACHVASSDQSKVDACDDRAVKRILAKVRSQTTYRIAQVKFSFDKSKREEALAPIRQCNEKLKTFLEMEDKLFGVEDDRRCFVISREQERELVTYGQHADHIYTLVQASWGCSCSHQHIAHVLLYHTPTIDRNLQLVMYWDRQDATNSVPRPWTQQGLQITWQQTQIVLSQSKAKTPTSPASIVTTVQKNSAFSMQKINRGVQGREKRNKGKGKEPMRRGETNSLLPSKTISPSCSSSLPSIKQCTSTMTCVPHDKTKESQVCNKKVKTLIQGTSTGSDKDITSLCLAMSNSGMTPAQIGALRDAASDFRYLVSTKPEHKLNASEVSLHDILHMRTAQLSPRDRLRVALAISHSHLKLHATSWAKHQWESKDIFFPRDLKDPCKIMFNKPYATVDFDTAEGKSHFANGQADRSFGCLGIMLLELALATNLESHPFWQTEGFRGQESDPTKRAVIAAYWAEDVIPYAGSKYHSAAVWCIKESPRKLEGSEWRLTLFEKVVKPLESSNLWADGADLS